jgi:hypothetical protein
MKKLYTIACLSFIVFVAQAQTFSPALKSTGTNTFTYNFSQVVSNTSKQIDFTISGVANGTAFKANIDQELDFVDYEYCSSIYGILYADSNFIISTGKSGVVTQNKGIISVIFNPKDFDYYNPIYGTDWEGHPNIDPYDCEQLTKANYGIKTATMTVTLFTPNATNYTLNLTGNSVDVITALENDNKVKTNSTSLFYPNPVKDVLILNQEATVYDAFGKLILSGKGSIEVSGLHSGIYFVQSAGQRQKFVKE